METIGILAGNGSLPFAVAERVRADGRRPFLVGIADEAEEHIESFDHRRVNWGRFGSVFQILEGQGARRLLFVGGIARRPDLKVRHLDIETVRALPSLLRMLASGDDTILSGVLNLFEQRGFEVLSVPDIAPDLVLDTGRVFGPVPTSAEKRQMDLASRFLDSTSHFDVGQGVVVCGTRIVAVEGVEGTDAMLDRVRRLRDEGRLSDRRDGVLVKLPKRGQDMRVDLPTIGPRTIMGAAAAGLKGVAGASGSTVLLDRDEVEELSERHSIFVRAVEAT